MRPMLASPGTTIPAGADWTHEIKWDGMRVLADVSAGRVRLWSRNEKEATVAFPELTGLAAAAPEDVLLDGEVVALVGGRPSFAALAERMHVSDPHRARTLAGTTPVTFMVFDVLRLYGVDLTSRTLADRRATLDRLELPGGSWQVSPAFDDGEALRAATLEQGLEGVVSKRLSSRYYPGRRSREWLKFPHRAADSVVVGGYRYETDSDTRIGAVLVGRPTRDGLAYLGRVGSGLAGKEGVRVMAALAGSEVEASPFADTVPRVDAEGTRWVAPRVVVDVQSLGLTGAGRLRQPSYRGLRPDLDPQEISQDISQDISADLTDHGSVTQ